MQPGAYTHLGFGGAAPMRNGGSGKFRIISGAQLGLHDRERMGSGFAATAA